MTTAEKSDKDRGNVGSHALEQYVLLAKSVRGAAAAELVRQVLEAPGVHVFGELLDMDHIKELEGAPQSNYYKLLQVFAFGNYRQYLEIKDNVPELTPIMRKKLQHLTIVDLATKMKCIPYSVLLEELDIRHVRDLEDLIIEAIYADIIRGKLDQRNSQLEVDYAIGRDTQPKDLDTIVATLQAWCEACETVLSCVDEQIMKANTDKNKHLKHREAIEQKILNIKKTLKTTGQDSDEAMTSDLREVQSGSDKGKKGGLRLKMHRGTSGSSGKFWP